MHDLTTFEQRFADRLDAELSNAVQPFDPAQIAAAAMGARRWQDRVRNWVGLGGGLPMPMTSRRLILVFAVAALLLVIVALAAGMNGRGGELALIRTNGDVVIANADGSAQRIVGHVPISSLRMEVVWAPDGRHLAAVGEDMLAIIDRDGNEASTRRLDARSSQVAWSPDGQRLAIFDGPWEVKPETVVPTRVEPHLDIVRPDGNLEWAVPLPAGFRYVLGTGEVAWSLDGQRLAITGFVLGEEFGLFPSSIWIVEIEARTVRVLTSDLGTTNDFHPRWLPDGRVLISRQDFGIVAVEPATNAESIVFEPEWPDSESRLVERPVLSPDGSRLALAAPGVGLAVLDLATGALTRLELPEGAGMLPLGWTADGKAVTQRWGIPTGAPFWPTSVAALDVETGKLTILADDVVAYDVRH